MTAHTATATGLYYELRGGGPAVLLIAGATGDAGQFSKTAELLADEFTVITYDRRGNSRSVLNVDDAGAAASIAAQADDAATLIDACGVGRATVFGTSGGATIALEMLTSHSQVMKGVVVHEPPLFALLPQTGPSPMQPIFDQFETDPRAAVERFVRVNAGDAAWEALEPAVRDRMLGNGTALFRHELPHFLSYRPDEDRLRKTRVPVSLLRSRDGKEFALPVNAWLEQVLGVETAVLTGHHAPYLDAPEVFAQEVRPILRQLSS